jgi:hypothetical protein
MLFRNYDLYQLLIDGGKELTLTQETGGTYDPATGSLTGSSSNSGTFLGYLFNNTLQAFGDTAIVRGNRSLVISSEDMPFEPDVGDVLTGDADGLRLASVSKIMSSDTVVCYICEVSE